MTRSEIRGTMRAAAMSIFRARQALVDSIHDSDVMLTPADMTEIRHALKESSQFLADIKKVVGQYGEVAAARAAMLVEV